MILLDYDEYIDPSNLITMHNWIGMVGVARDYRHVYLLSYYVDYYYLGN